MISLLDNIFPEQKTPSIKEQFTFDPCGGWEYINHSKLSLTLSESFEIKPGSDKKPFFSITHSELIFNNRLRLQGIDAKEIAYLHQYGVNMRTNVNFGKHSLEAYVQFQFDGYFQISLKLDNVGAILVDLISSLLTLSDTPDPLSSIKDLIPGDLSSNMKVVFTISYQNGFKLTSLAMGFNLKLQKLDLELLYDYTNRSIRGGILETGSGSVSQNSLAHLLESHAGVSSPDQQLEEAKLSNFSFLAQLKDGYYQISADLHLPDGWTLIDKIKLTDLSIQVNKEDKDISASLTAMLSLSTQTMLINLAYEKGWSGEVDISQFTLNDLSACFPIS